MGELLSPIWMTQDGTLLQRYRAVRREIEWAVFQTTSLIRRLAVPSAHVNGRLSVELRFLLLMKERHLGSGLT